MIACPTCGSETTVLETRDTPNYVRRRRICKDPSCGIKVTTAEVILHQPNRGRGGDLVMVRKADVGRLFELASAMLAARGDEEVPCPE